jgi:hypothetical protein
LRLHRQHFRRPGGGKERKKLRMKIGEDGTNNDVGTCMVHV